jgi:hypothetical protein
MELLLEEKKVSAYKIIDKLDDENIDRALAFLELSSIKVNRDPSRAISGEELIDRVKKRIEGWWEK